MNLLAKKKIAWFLTIGVLLFGCKDEDFGLELPPDAQQSEVKFKEFILPSTNVYFDSLRTDDGGTIIIGEYSDDVYGSIQSTGYSEYFYRNGPLPSEDISFDTLSFDSVTISLRIAALQTTETEVLQSLEFYELTDTIFSNVLYLANRTIPFGDQIGANTDSFDPEEFRADEDTVLTFRLDDAFGQEMFDFIADLETTETDTLTSRKIKFPGIAFVSNGSTGIVSFDMTSTDTNLNFHSSSQDSSYVNRFQFATANHFNQVTRDRTGSDFETIANKKALDPSPDYVYFSPIAGIHPKIDLTDFIEFSKQENNIFIQEARLSIDTEENSDNVPSINTIRLYFSKDLNDNTNVNWPGAINSPFESLLLNDGAYSGFQPSIASISYNSEELSYQSSPTIFSQIIYDNARSELDGLAAEDRSPIEQSIAHVDDLIMVNGTTLSLGNMTIPKNGIKLQIFYAQLKE